MLTVNDESELEALIIHFYSNKGLIDDGKRVLDCRFRGEYDWESLYTQLDLRGKSLFNPVLVRMIQEYQRLFNQYPQFNDEVSCDFLTDLEVAVNARRINLAEALPTICDYVETRTLEKRSASLHHIIINLLSAVGRELLTEKWKQLYDSQPDQYKAHLHMAIVYADCDLAEELLPDLKAKVDSITYLRNVFSTVRRKYNPRDTAEDESTVRRILLQYALREEWVASEWGKGFSAKGIETFFGGS